MNRLRTILTFAALSVVLLLGGVYIWRAAKPVATEGAVAIGGPFKLIDQKGAAVDETLLRGKLTAVFFGYTFCPDVCPTTLANLGKATDLMGPDASRMQVVFITVDPERDTPAALATYLSSPAFPKGIIGLTGSPAQVAAVAKAYHVYYQKVPQGSSYSMDHSAVIYLMDRQGRFLRPLDVGAAPPDIARQLREALNAA